jgi:hypothetical protein
MSALRDSLESYLALRRVSPPISGEPTSTGITGARATGPSGAQIRLCWTAFPS